MLVSRPVSPHRTGQLPPRKGRARRRVGMTGRCRIGQGRTLSANRALITTPLCPRCQRTTMRNSNLCYTDAESSGQRKPPGWLAGGPVASGVLCLSLERPFRHRPRITWDGSRGVIRHRPLRVSPPRMIKPVRASIRARVGNKLGTVLATSAPCGHHAKTPRWRRASLGFVDFRHHRNLFPIPRVW